jgi:MSHA biogenesis protein MshM
VDKQLLDFFQLNCDPFSLTPNTQLYCRLPQYNNIIETLSYAIKSEDGICLVTAEVGYGKTMICRKLLTKLSEDDGLAVCYIHNPSQSKAELINLMISELGGKNNSALTGYGLLQTTILKLSQKNKKVVIMVDEAQALSTSILDFIRLLTNLETEAEKLVKVVLFGQPELLIKLKDKTMRQFLQRVSTISNLEALSKQNTALFIDHRVENSGANSNLFSPAAKKAVWKYSKGVPRLINVIAKRAMLYGFSKGDYYLKSHHIKKAKNNLELQISCSTGANKSKHKKLYYILLGLIVFCVLFITADLSYLLLFK